MFSVSSIQSYRKKISIIYNGISEDFKKIAKVKTESEYVTDGFDRYPYYSGNSRWVTYYRCFDNDTQEIEVKCLEDNVTLLYGTLNRKDDELPKIKQ
ncbi:MAG: hypothetical protein IJW82_02795 [Clostridia bacterium]|nr:hypothetical protein [Clostridia bacterium]